MRTLFFMVVASVVATYTIRYIDKKLTERAEVEAKYRR